MKGPRDVEGERGKGNRGARDEDEDEADEEEAGRGGDRVCGGGDELDAIEKECARRQRLLQSR